MSINFLKILLITELPKIEKLLILQFNRIASTLEAINELQLSHLNRSFNKADIFHYRCLSLGANYKFNTFKV
jgi:hypothetical protein